MQPTGLVAAAPTATHSFTRAGVKTAFLESNVSQDTSVLLTVKQGGVDMSVRSRRTEQPCNLEKDLPTGCFWGRSGRKMACSEMQIRWDALKTRNMSEKREKHENKRKNPPKKGLVWTLLWRWCNLASLHFPDKSPACQDPTSPQKSPGKDIRSVVLQQGLLFDSQMRCFPPCAAAHPPPPHS